MKRCELCGEAEHEGKPCYMELRKQWHAEAVQRFFAQTPQNAVFRFGGSDAKLCPVEVSQ